jgi:hypothetical protein
MKREKNILKEVLFFMLDYVRPIRVSIYFNFKPYYNKK